MKIIFLFFCFETSLSFFLFYPTPPPFPGTLGWLWKCLLLTLARKMWLWIVLALSLGVKGDLDQWCKTQGKVVKCDRLKETNWSERRDCCWCPREWPFWRSPQSVYRGCRRPRCGEPICSTVPTLRDFPLWLSIAVSEMHRQVDIKKYIGYIHLYIFFLYFLLYCRPQPWHLEKSTK